MDGEVINRVDQRPLLHEMEIQTSLLSGDGGRQPGGAGAHNDDVVQRHE
jgi:hypothetical protein